MKQVKLKKALFKKKQAISAEADNHQAMSNFKAPSIPKTKDQTEQIKTTFKAEFYVF